jgi:squalene synthase HpnC
LFLSRKRRAYISAIYAFARTADDFADEGEWKPEERLRRLDEWGEKLEKCFAGKADDPVFIALAETISQLGIPKKPLADLLTAFRMDVLQNRFATFDNLLHYCRHSANPVGLLVLYVFDSATSRNIGLSDNICTALQLANFWQDVSIDRKKGRVYIPLEDLDRFGYTEADLDQRAVDDRFRDLMRFEVDRTKELFAAGKPLLNEVAGMLRFELKLTWGGGMTILRKIETQGYNVLGTRPKISTKDKALIVLRALAHRT